jgi:hypothetical protein
MLVIVLNNSLYQVPLSRDSVKKKLISRAGSGGHLAQFIAAKPLISIKGEAAVNL